MEKFYSIKVYPQVKISKGRRVDGVRTDPIIRNTEDLRSKINPKNLRDTEPRLKSPQENKFTETSPNPRQRGPISRTGLDSTQGITVPKENPLPGGLVSRTSTNPLPGGLVSRTGKHTLLGGQVSRTGSNKTSETNNISQGTPKKPKQTKRN